MRAGVDMTGTTEADKARARENRMKLIAANPDKRCPPEHKHGATNTCYSGHGCRCVQCRKARAKRRRDYDHTTKQMKGRDVWVSAVLSRDRLRALAWQGWSALEVSTRAGLGHMSVQKLRKGVFSLVHQSTEKKIAAVYKELALVRNMSHAGKITRSLALSNGWLSPMDVREAHRGARPRVKQKRAARVDVAAVRAARTEGMSWLACERKFGVSVNTLKRRLEAA